jgi:hypothetical protein
VNFEALALKLFINIRLFFDDKRHT